METRMRTSTKILFVILLLSGVCDGLLYLGKIHPVENWGAIGYLVDGIIGGSFGVSVTQIPIRWRRKAL